jgi:hypothetical protein
LRRRSRRSEREDRTGAVIVTAPVVFLPIG